MKKIYVKSATSNGVAIGKARFIKKAEISIDDIHINTVNIENEICRYKRAVATACSHLEQLAKKSDIFKGQLMLIKDIALEMSVLEAIRSGKNTEQAVSEAIHEYENAIRQSDSRYLRERSSDIRDIGSQILYSLQGEVNDRFESISEASVVIADELVPSDIPAIFRNSNIKGIITRAGGSTGHVSILVREFGIAAIIGAGDSLSQITHNDEIIMDAAAGLIIVNPDGDIYDKYFKKAEERAKEEDERANEGAKVQISSGTSILKPAKSKTLTADGRAIRIYINAGSIEEVRFVKSCGAEGVGLFRSEILFMQYKHFPGEEEQYKAYKEAAEAAGGPLVIRALDIGGDKELPYFKAGKEDNPALGWRGIRILLDNADIFKTQLRAVLRASAYGKVKLLLPMISSVKELIKAKELLEQCKQELQNEQVAFDENLETGIMVETPAAVLNIDILAKQADFLSIGTNDLTQYLLAVDRANNRVTEMYNSLHPAVIRSIDIVIKAGKKYNKKVSLCGEMAGDPGATRLLIGMGLKELSMTAGSIAQVRNIIAESEYKQAKQLAKQALSAASSEEIIRLLSL